MAQQFKKETFYTFFLFIFKLTNEKNGSMNIILKKRRKLCEMKRKALFECIKKLCDSAYYIQTNTKKILILIDVDLKI